MNDTRRSAGVFALTACAALAISASAAADVVLYEAGKTPGARIDKKPVPAAIAAEATNQQDCKLVVTGSWDVSECGVVELRFAGPVDGAKEGFCNYLITSERKSK